MTMMRTLFVGGAAIAALASAAPSAAQYYNGYNNGYANAYGYNRNMTAVAAQQCSAAVQNRLYRTGGNSLGIIGQLFGVNTVSNGGRVLSISQVTPRRGSTVVRGLATSGRSTGYGAYGYGAYGAAGYSYQPDLSFRCDVDYRGQVRNVSINRR